MTRRDREHPPRIDRPVDPVGWAVAMQTERVTLLVKAALHRSGHLRTRPVDARALQHLPNEVPLRRQNPYAFIDAARALSRAVYCHAVDTDTAVDFEGRIEESATGIHIRALYKMVSRFAPMLVSFSPDDIQRSLEEHPLSLSNATAEWLLLKTAENNSHIHRAIDEAIAVGDIDSADLSNAAATRFNGKALPDKILSHMRSSDRGSIAYFLTLWLGENPHEQRMPWHIESAAGIALQGSISGLTLVASVFPDHVPEQVVPKEARLEIDALFTAHRFPFGMIGGLVARGYPDSALDVVFGQLNSLLVAGDFAGVDAVLERVPVGDGADPDVTLGYLTMAFPAAHRLKNFSRLADKMRPWMVSLYGPKQAAELLSFHGVN